jgi:hypothetical protein
MTQKFQMMGTAKRRLAPGPDPGAGQLIRDRKACVTMGLI